MKIVLLGAGGFIGSHLVEHLIARGEHDVIGVDVTDEKLVGIRGPRFRFIEADIRDATDLMDRLAREADVLVDLVAYANPSIYVETPVEVFDLNFMQNLRIAELCMKHGTRLIQYSSAEVYGKQNEGDLYYEDETDSVLGPVTKHRWIYASAKSLLERVLHAYGLSDQLDYTIIRPFNFIGSRIDYLVPAGTMGGPRVFPQFMSALLTGGPMYLVDGGHVHRAFLHIDDASAAFQTLLDNVDAAHNQIFNVGNPDNNITIRGLALLMRELYQELTGIEPACEIVEVGGEEFYGVGYEDANRLPPSVDKLRRLGWQPRRDLRDTFGEAMRIYLAQGWPQEEPRHANTGRR